MNTNDKEIDAMATLLHARVLHGEKDMFCQQAGKMLLELKAEVAELQAAQRQNRNYLEAAEKRLAELRSALEKIATKNLDFQHVARVALDKDEVHP